MTLLAVPIMVESLEQGLAAAVRAAAGGADLVEFRIDTFADAARASQVRDLVERSVLPCIVTCRPVWEGGGYDGDEQNRISLLEQACLGNRKPAYLDVELAAYERSANVRQKVGLVVDHADQVKAASTGLILSSHDFQGRPGDLRERVGRMASAPACKVVKIAWKASDLRDNLEAIEMVRTCAKPAIALCMGEEGLASRVLAKKFGAMLTFASLDASGATAPGQPTVTELKGLYRWEKIGRSTRVYGVIGWPVGHSMSPAIHNAGFDAVAGGFNGVYLPMPIRGDYGTFKDVLDGWLGMKALDFRGASVTIPHKEHVLRYVRERGDGRDAVEALAGRIGAANTLTVRDDGSLYVCNTDYAGALEALCEAMKIEPGELRGVRVGVIGAGGAARAIAAGLADHGATVVVYGRTMDRAEALAAELKGFRGKMVAARLEKLCDSCCQVLINCTPVGMHPNVDQTPVPAEFLRGLDKDVVVFDTVYNPIQTRLVREAAEAGCRVVRGVEMFVRQAGAQFKLWTGREAPLEVFRGVVEGQLNRE